MEMKKCIACGLQTLKTPDVRNALSRFCSKYICEECGMRESFEGDFWHGAARFGKARKRAN